MYRLGHDVSLAADAHIARTMPESTGTAHMVEEIRLFGYPAEASIEIEYEAQGAGILPLSCRVTVNSVSIPLTLSLEEQVEVVRRYINEEKLQAQADAACINEGN